MRNQYARKMKAALSQSKMKVNMQRQRDKYSQMHFQSNIQSNKQAPRLIQSQEMAATPDPDLKRSLKE